MIATIEFEQDYILEFYNDAMKRIEENTELWHAINEKGVLNRLDSISDIDISEFASICNSLNIKIQEFILPKNVIKAYDENQRQVIIDNYMIGEVWDWSKQADIMSANYYDNKVMITMTSNKDNNGFVGVYDIEKVKWIKVLKFPDVCGIVFSNSLQSYIIGVFKENFYGIKECSLVILKDDNSYEVRDIFKDTWSEKEQNKYVHEYDIKLIEELDGCIIDQNYDGIYLDDSNKICYIKKDEYFFIYIFH